MAGQSTQPRKAQLDKEEREHLEDVVTEMRDRVEANVRYQLEDEYDLDEKPDDASLSEEQEDLVEAIELEAADGHNWDEAHEQYITGVGYTIVNRLAALRCMEVRDFIDNEVTAFRDDGLTPAADRLVTEEFMLEEEAVLEAYRNACDDLAEEIEILFDRSTVYSLIDPDDDTFEGLCEMLDKVSDEVWRGDDVLGWVYEYYNRPVVEALDAKNTLEPEDVGPANQFYTPHWVVRMLTDNSLGKLYLEAKGQESAVPEPEALSPEERKKRLVTPEDSPTVPELCTYLISDEEPGEAPEFDHPSELRVIDPACGSGHFLLYAFDVLERIWWEEEDELDRAEIPAKILKHNLYGVDIDLRSCQLSAFNLYLKARTRAEEEDGQFEMPNVDIVCADARVAEVEKGAEVLDEITGEGTDLREALGEIIDTFQHTEALGSLLDVSGMLEEVFESGQTGLSDWGDGTHQSLNSFLKALREEVDERSSDSFGEQNLKSFLNLLVVLTQEYDVSLMNPPYGARRRMPDGVQDYVEDYYNYSKEYYINFFERCDQLARPKGRIGMLVPRSFMFIQSFRDFRTDFIGGEGSFDFLAEFGLDVLDNAMVRTAGTVVRSGTESNDEGTFIRLDDVKKEEKESSFLHTSFVNAEESDIQRIYRRELEEFSMIPGAPLSYWVPRDLRKIYESREVLGEKGAKEGQSGIGAVRQGIATGNDDRFVRRFWTSSEEQRWVPFPKGGEDTWLLPRVTKSLLWDENGAEVRRQSGGNGTPNEDLYFNQGVTYNRVKTSGRRFGYMHENSIFGDKGPAIFSDGNEWNILSYANSTLFTYLMLCRTPERMWEVGVVGEIPWHDSLQQPSLKEAARDAVGAMVSNRQFDFTSPHYIGPILLAMVGETETLPLYEHSHRDLRENVETISPAQTEDLSSSLSVVATNAARYQTRIKAKLQDRSNGVDAAVFDSFDIDVAQRETVRQEIALRTIEDPREQEEYNPETITEPDDDFPEQVKDLLLHFALRAVNDTDDGIIPLSEIDGQDDLLTHIEEQFERVWEDHATDRLAEVDDVLGNRSAADEAYPNLREWLADDLFEYHVSKFERTPILWRISSKQLVSDPEGEGFGCLVDYHQLDASIFDRLQNQYLEPRRTHLRERRAAANSRRNDESLSTSERADAAEEYERCESGLEQLSVFEEQLGELAESDPRDWPDENQERAAEAAQRVAEFRARTATRLDTLETLANLDDVDMEDLFSPSFYETVQDNKDEWIDALNDLEAAFEAYAEDGTMPVEAHLSDLFEYYDDLTGSSHYASNGILFMTYYFEQFEDAGQAQIGDAGVSERQRLLSELAADVDEYKELAEELSEDCDVVAADTSTDWEERALSEVTTAGYQPNHKHGVVINITPLAEKDIVPEVVDDKVL